MRILALDISTKTGWSLTENVEGQSHPNVLKYGHICAEQRVADFGSYPENYINMADYMATHIVAKVLDTQPDLIVIEETNSSKSRYTQKVLEFLHCAVLQHLQVDGWISKVRYVNTSDWRKICNVQMTAADKKNNAKVSRLKKNGKSKKDAGVKGKITRKHLAIRIVDETFGIKFKQKENDIAEAILLGTAQHLGVANCTGSDTWKKKKANNES